MWKRNWPELNGIELVEPYNTLPQAGEFMFGLLHFKLWERICDKIVACFYRAKLQKGLYEINAD